MRIFRYSYEQMMRGLMAMEQDFKGRIRTRVLELSSDGRAIVEARLGKENAEHHVLVHAGIHGREYLNSALLVRLMADWLADGEEFKYLAEAVCVHVLPMVNPDGCSVSQEGLKGIRTPALREELQQCYVREAGNKSTLAGYFSTWKANARGVDINRNFPSGWDSYRGPDLPGAEGFKGRAPGCEAETRALLKVVREYPLDCGISYHSSGNLIYWDYGTVGRVREAERCLALSLAKDTGYELRSTVEDELDGAGLSDYLMRECGIPGVTVETGTAPCPLPAQEFPEIYAHSRGVLRAAAEFCFLQEDFH